MIWAGSEASFVGGYRLVEGMVLVDDCPHKTVEPVCLCEDDFLMRKPMRWVSDRRRLTCLAPTDSPAGPTSAKSAAAFSLLE